MAISIPIEPVYYYECSNGEFRLIYFIPIQKLQTLVKQKKIDQKVIDDFPDGVDLDCTEPDYQEFFFIYNYRPRHSPESLCQSFLAIFSSTKDWNTFKGSGYIAAEDIERNVEGIEHTLKERKLTPDQIPVLPEKPTFKMRGARKNKKVVLKSRVNKYLQKLEVKGVDKKQCLNKQTFRKIKMGKGKENPVDFYKRLNLKLNN